MKVENITIDIIARALSRIRFDVRGITNYIHSDMEISGISTYEDGTFAVTIQPKEEGVSYSFHLKPGKGIICNINQQRIRLIRENVGKPIGRYFSLIDIRYTRAEERPTPRTDK